MPRLSEFYGIAVYMYWKDHHPPHFHAIYGDDEALVRIEDSRFLAGSLPRTAARLVREWTELHRSELLANWERALAFDPLVPIEPLRYGEAMSRPARVVAVEPLGDYRLRLTFSDALVRELDFDGVLRGPVFEPLQDPAEFVRVAVDEVAGTIVWPSGVDLDPDVLHGDHAPATGRVPTVLREYRLRPTG